MIHRRTLFATGAAGLMAAPAVAQNTRASTLRFVPQANLSVLDPIFTTATVTGNHGYYVYDTLYASMRSSRPSRRWWRGTRRRRTA